MMMNLFHGSHVKVDKPSVKAGRRNLDFGRGFYVTNLKTQAEKWGVIVGSRYNDDDEGIVNQYELDEDAGKGYDAVEGGVANDQVIDTVEDFENGRITAEQALDQLRFKKPNHQLCIRNQEILDKHLKFISCYTVKDEG